jgi:hypothetical protein
MARTKQADRDRKRLIRAARYAAGLTAAGLPRRRAAPKGTRAAALAPKRLP